MNRQRLLLIILVGLLVLALFYAFWARPQQRRTTESGSQQPIAVSRNMGVDQAPKPVVDNRVHLDLLAREKEDFPGFKRNIFRFYQPPVKLLPAKPLAPPPPPPPPPPVSDESPVTVEVQRELARFTFLGFLRKDGEKTIFLSSGDDIFVVKRGDRFGKEKSFVITDLTPEKLTIRQDEDPRPIVVSLVEQAPLAVSPEWPSTGGGAFSPSPLPRRGYLPPPRRGEMPAPSESEGGDEEVENEEQPVAEEAPPDVMPKEVPHD